MQVLTDLSQADLIALLSATQAKLEAAKAAGQRKVTLKVTEKGGLSMYGLGRFPVTLYRSQWEKLLAEAPHVSAFIEANAALLTTKD